MMRVSKRLSGPCVIAAFLGVMALAIVVRLQGQSTHAAEGDEPSPQAEAAATEAETRPGNLSEARGRARLLHETIHGVLQVVHRDFFREDEKLPIPSQSFEEVFEELARSQKVNVRWLAVDTEAMHADHKPTGDFDKQAVKALRSGQTEFESLEDGSYRYVGTIRLSAHCLKCHLPSRTSNKDRAAGLVISFPMKNSAK